jgi:hypothetical protein
VGIVSGVAAAQCGQVMIDSRTIALNSWRRGITVASRQRDLFELIVMAATCIL